MELARLAELAMGSGSRHAEHILAASYRASQARKMCVVSLPVFVPSMSLFPYHDELCCRPYQTIELCSHGDVPVLAKRTI